MADIKPLGTGDRVAAVLLIISAIVFVMQGFAILSLTDDQIIGMVKVATKKQPHSISAAEIDSRIDARRSEVIEKSRGGDGVGKFGIKFVAALAVAAIAAGIRMRKPSPTRLLCILIGLLMAVGAVVVFKDMGSLEFYTGVLPAWMYLGDMLSLGTIPIAMFICFAYFRKGAWFAPEPEKSWNRPVEPKH